MNVNEEMLAGYAVILMLILMLVILMLLYLNTGYVD